MDDGGDRRGVESGRSVTRREALTRATYGVGGLLLLRASGGSAATAADKRPATAAPTAARRAPAVVPMVAHAPTRLPGGGQPRAVCDGQSGVVVVGLDEGDQPMSWHSRDGRRWDAQHLPAPASGEAEVWGVAAHGARYVAVGSVLQRRAAQVTPDQAVAQAQADVTFATARRRPTVWWTGDGVTWAGRIIDATSGPHAQLIAVSCNGSTLVAVGSTLDADGVQGDGALVLTSRDGQRWEEGEIVASADLPEGSLTGVAAAGQSWFATGSDMTGGSVWTSADGRRWSMLASSRRQFAGMTLQGLGVRGRHVHVAATRLADQATRYYTSSDGCRTWRRMRARTSGFDRSNGTVTNLTVIDGDMVVVGTRGAAPVIEGGIVDGGH